MKLNYYARLKEDDVCIEIISTPKDLKDVKGYIFIADYNESLLYKKYNKDTGWSAESYEPEVDAVIQDRLDNLEKANEDLMQENLDLQLALVELAETNTNSITELQLALAELASMGVE